VLDIFVMFWALAAFGLPPDRRTSVAADCSNARPELRATNPAWTSSATWRSLRWWMGVRWWRIAGAVCLGLTAGTKWSGLYFAVVFGVMIIFWTPGRDDGRPEALVQRGRSWE
jgi:hypothetical protein